LIIADGIKSKNVQRGYFRHCCPRRGKSDVNNSSQDEKFGLGSLVQSTLYNSSITECVTNKLLILVTLYADVKYADHLVLMLKEGKVLQGTINELIEIGICYGM
jgi:hypothetical protein